MLKRTWVLITLVYLVLAESLSWLPVPDLALCLIEPEHGQQSADHDDKKHCPAFHVGAALVFEKANAFLEAHDKSVVGGFTIVLAISTIGLWLATNKLWAAGEKQFGLLAETAAAQSRDMQASITVAQDSAKAAKRAADVAEKTIAETDRAWISVSAEVIGPLVFEKDRIHIGIGFNMVNIGRSPATHVEMWAELCPDIVEAKNRGDEYADITRVGLLDLGCVLFPGERREDDRPGLKMPTDRFRVVAQETSGSSANPGIMVCVAYRLSGSRSVRHTVMLYQVDHIERFHLGWDGSEGETGLAYLKLVQTVMSGKVT